MTLHTKTTVRVEEGRKRSVSVGLLVMLIIDSGNAATSLRAMIPLTGQGTLELPRRYDLSLILQ